MQDALLGLTEYWAALGCTILQPVNTEVGAGTLNPATSLRVLGPEPWRVAYVEPSVRPDDSRYGDNPNRLQTHTQFQVVLKPEPGDPQRQYLSSLKTLGIDLDRHDVRFVEDNWASAALGAWGLGWEVWLDGLEITQFTYFQQAGGVPLDPVCVELTYGMERIMMALQGVTDFKDILYAPGISYGEAFGQAEYEMSRYYLDDADIETNRTLFEAYAAEARRLIDARLPVPAHTYVLKCSHAFNVLDSRGAISTTERAQAFGRMRTLSHEVAKLWLERRAELGHPLRHAILTSPDAVRLVPYPEINSPQPLAFEIGVEEIPPSEATRTAEAVEAALTDRLEASRLAHGAVRVVASPRRVVALVDDVQPREADHQQTSRGPRVDIAFDPSGAPSKAALGFARSQSAEVADLQRLQIQGAEYVAVVREVRGRSAAEVLAQMLPEIVSGLRAEINMRWNAPGLAFTRPIRWILALLGDQVVPFSISTLSSGRTTEVHRAAREPVVEIASARGYLERLRGHGIEADQAERRRLIVDSSAGLAASVGGRIDAAGDKAVIDEVTYLVEQPNSILASFDRKYLSLPPEVLSTVMKKHQRYLPVRDADGNLLPYFIAIANGTCDQDAVRAGNEAVLRARYEDASFYWAKDLGVAPEAMRRALARLTFQEELGSMSDRARRIAAVAAALADRVDLDRDQRAALGRAGELAKFDLASEMVIELPSLAGIMAREYALRAGEPALVATALFDMELPRQAGDLLPSTLPGAILALADRFDLIAGLFAVGAAPTGSSDPFGLRRAALGIVGILRSRPEMARVTLAFGLEIAGSRQPVPVTEAVRQEALQFVLRRFEQLMVDSGLPFEVVRAVMPLAATPARAEEVAKDLMELRHDLPLRELATAMQRVRRIVPAETVGGWDPARFEADAEGALSSALLNAQAHLGDGDVSLRQFVRSATDLVEPIDRFFVDVLVMAEDPEVRANRLGLLAGVRDLGFSVLDWDALN